MNRCNWSPFIGCISCWRHTYRLTCAKQFAPPSSNVAYKYVWRLHWEQWYWGQHNLMLVNYSALAMSGKIWPVNQLTILMYKPCPCQLTILRRCHYCCVIESICHMTMFSPSFWWDLQSCQNSFLLLKLFSYVDSLLNKMSLWTTNALDMLAKIRRFISLVV